MTAIITILVIHFLGDFVFQTRSMGLNKGKSVMWLSIHVGVYLATLLVFGLALGHNIIEGNDMKPILEYCLINAALHWVTDFITSKGSGYCYKRMLKAQKKSDKKKEYFWQYNFWTVIGLDQLIHAICLLTTFDYIFL